MANSIDTELENAFIRAQATSNFSGTLFNDLVTKLVYQGIPDSGSVNKPSLQGLRIYQPDDPELFEIDSQLEAMKAATEDFADKYFPPQPELDSAISVARTTLESCLNGETVPLSRFMTTYFDADVLRPHTGSSLLNQTGLTIPAFFYTDDTVYADKLKAHYETARVLFRDKIDARLLVEFRKYAMGLLLKVDLREEAIRATTSYVIALGDVENTAGENLIRINQAKASMAASISKWFAAQISNDVEERVEFAGTKYAVGKEIVAGTTQYAEIEAKVRSAQAGASVLIDLAANARNTISAITSAAKVGFE